MMQISLIGCCCVYIPPTASHMETGTQLSLIRQTGELEPATPGLQGKRFVHYTTVAPS